MHQAFPSISLLSLHNYDVKWPNVINAWEPERQGDLILQYRFKFWGGPQITIRNVWKEAKLGFQSPMSDRQIP